MSLIISVRVDDGIVMASDSRVTITTNRQHEVHFSDTTYKTFCLGGCIGVSTCGDAHVQGRAVTSWMQVFEKEVFDHNWSVLKTMQNLATFFAGLRINSSITFHVGGYEKVADATMIPVTYHVIVRNDGSITKSRQDSGPGAMWDGMTETISRLIKGVLLVAHDKMDKYDTLTRTIVDESGVKRTIEYSNVRVVPGNTTYYQESNIDFQYFTLQDAIDFATYAIKTTIDTIKFKSESLTVGEPIDILVIEPSGARWIAHKELHA